MKTHQGLKKRIKKSKPKSRPSKYVHQSKGRGSRHLKTKQSNKRKRRIRRAKKLTKNKSLRKTAVPINW